MKLQSSITAVAALALFGASHAQAATVTVYDSNGYDTRFTAGLVLQGQDPLFGPWQTTTANNPDSAFVQNGVGVGGTNGVTLTASPSIVTAPATPSTDQQYFVNKPMLPTLATPFVNVSWNERVTRTNNNGLEFGPFFGVEITDAASTPGTRKQIGGFGVDATTGDLLELKNFGGVAQYDTPTTRTLVNFGSYYSFAISVDYTNKTYSVSLGGTVLDTIPFVDPTATAFTDADLSIRFLSNDGEQALNTGSANFDNYVIAITTVPEPMSLAGFAGLGLLLSRRRR